MAVSLSAIMSEQFAVSLHQREREEAPLTHESEPPLSDFELALRLQLEEDGLASEPEGRTAVRAAAVTEAAVVPQPDEDADLAMALQLQEETDRAEEEERQRRRAQQLSSGNVNVVVRSAGGRAAPAAAPPRRLLTAADANSSSSTARPPLAEDTADLEAAQKEREEAALLAQLAGKVVRVRPGAELVPEGTAHLITKHDAYLSGRRAARDLERSLGQSSGDLSSVLLSQSAVSSLRRHNQKQTAKGHAAQGRVEEAQHATQEGVLDRRTRMILFKLVASGRLRAVGGVCKVGKEASVYLGVGWDSAAHAALAANGAHSQNAQTWADGGEGRTGKQQPAELEEDGGGEARDDSVEAGEEEDEAAGSAWGGAAGDVASDAGDLPDVALKVFRLTLNEFKDRRAYMEGDHRYAHLRLARHNPRQLISLWAEKEFKNLIRAHRAGIPSPAPLLLRGHVIVMSFIGAEGWPAPQLREAGALSHATWQRLYSQTAAIMHALYQWCHLVHGDLSEYNLLYFDKRVVAIDMGQAVDTSHPYADELLAADAATVTAFFRRKGALTLPPDSLVRLVKDAALAPHPPASALRTGSLKGKAPVPGSGLMVTRADVAAQGSDPDAFRLALAAAAAGQASDAKGLEEEMHPAAEEGAAAADSGAADVDHFDGETGPVAAELRRLLDALE